MGKRRTKGDGGLSQRHDHASCPAEILVETGDGETITARPAHTCKGRWVGTFTVALPTGRKVRKTVYGKTQAEAKAKLNKAQRDAESGVLVVQAETVESWGRKWLDIKRDQKLKPSTLYRYLFTLERHVFPHIGRLKLAELQPDNIRAIYKLLDASGLAPGTVNGVHRIIKTCLRDAVIDGKILASPADRVRAPENTPTQERGAYTVAQAHMILKAAGDNPRWWLALFYGMRQGEVLGLKWCDVDFANRVIRVRQTLQRDRHEGTVTMILGEPKSKASVRDIPMFPMIEARLKVLYLSKGQPDGDTLVFGTRNGKPTAPSDDYRSWVRLLDEAAVVPFAPLPRMALHCARNTAASVMDEAGLSPRVIADILGHAEVQMTFRYQRTDTERMRNELGKVTDLFPAMPLAVESQQLLELPPASGE